MRIALLAPVLASLGCLVAPPPGVPLYPNSDVQRLPADRVASLAGPIARVDGREVADLGGLFELLPGCHLVELSRQMPPISYALSNGTYLSGQLPPMLFAVRMKAGARYSIRRDFVQSGAGQSGRIVATAREELPGRPINELSPAQSDADVRACKAWEASGMQDAPAAAAAAVPGLPARFAWTSTAPLIVPKSDAKHDLVAVKDPTIVRYNGRWHVYATSVARGGIYGMVYTSFADWNDAPAAPLYFMDQTRGFNTYVAAPQLFFFTPQKKWYLLYQSGPPMFSTADDPGDPTKWTEPAPFFARTPAIVDKNGGWLDFWVICDAQNCHLFFSNDHGRWYRSQTPLAKFPYGFSDPVVVLEDAEAGRVFEASNVYKIGGTNRYLALIEAFDKSSDFHRYFRSWTAEHLEGPWTPLDADAAVPFAGAVNVTFAGAPWTRDISHGEMIRAGADEMMVIDGTKLAYLYQGFDPEANAPNYNAIPWRLGLLTPR